MNQEDFRFSEIKEKHQRHSQKCSYLSSYIYPISLIGLWSWKQSCLNFNHISEMITHWSKYYRDKLYVFLNDAHMKLSHHLWNDMEIINGEKKVIELMINLTIRQSIPKVEIEMWPIENFPTYPKAQKKINDKS